MKKISLQEAAASDAAVYFCGSGGELFADLPEGIRAEARRQARAAGGGGKEPLVFPALGLLPEKVVCFLPLAGDETERRRKLLQQAKQIPRLCRKLGCQTLSLRADEKSQALPALLYHTAALGLRLGNYLPAKITAAPKTELPLELAWAGSDRPEIAGAIDRAALIGRMVNDMRQLVNRPANRLTPAILAEEAARLASDHPERCQILRGEQLAREGYGALLAVGQGSAQEPCLVILRHQGGTPADPTLGLVGKGITFDSGGLCLKPAGDMPAMVSDMCGAAAVLGVWQTAQQQNLPLNLVAVLALAENMPGGGACKPGDVIRTASGRTVEIVNTDAEGRLILADGITAAIAAGATRLIDVATLTGAARLALGREATACLTNNEPFFALLETAARQALEDVWLMPSYPAYEEQLESQLADLRNLGDGKGAGMQVGGLFLKPFTNGLPWIHLDIGGSVAPEPDSKTGYTVPMARTLAEFCYLWAEEGHGF
ncbi:MAG: leucyl aminopeptidase family protein [Peptococcaceae bacterium]|jgi:leucyl aminopeptidase|nr:leucyl aminopeptidase family protein [Peptococcaceae bacterium]